MRIFVCFFLFYSFVASAKPQVFVLKSKKNIEQSILIRKVSSRKVLFEHKPHKALTPASLAKLFCAASFLKAFGKKNNLQTTIHHSGKRTKGVVKGDLIIKGGGDPRLVSEDLWKIAHDMKHLGYKEFTGNIVLDNSLFSSNEINKNRTRKTSNKAYNAPISALGVNFNTYNVVVGPGKKVGGKAHVSLYPYPLEGTKILNYVKTVRSKKRNYISIHRKVRKGKEIIVVRGKIHKNSRLRKFYRAAYDPTKFTGETIRSFLKAQNIKVRGKVKEGKLSDYKNTRKILNYKSQSIAKLTKDFLLYSSNYMTDMLVSTLGAHTKSKNLPENRYQAGLKSVQDLLPKKIFSKSPFVFVSGSGLEPENKMSSYHVVELLMMMSKNFEVFPEFLNALPKSGINGSLRKRFKESRLRSMLGKIRAKTGTLTQPVSVSSLAGYMQHKKHGLIAFSIIQNGVRGRKQPNIFEMRQSQEYGLFRILKKL